jgi:hypothetical protein
MMKDKELYHRLCGLERSTFNDLVNDLEMPFKQLNWRAMPRINITDASDLAVDIALWITLFWMRQYPTGVVMGAIFDCHERTLHRVFKRTITALMKVFHEELKWPSDDELLSWKLPSNENKHIWKIWSASPTWTSINTKIRLRSQRHLHQFCKTQTSSEYRLCCQSVWQNHLDYELGKRTKWLIKQFRIPSV